MSNNFGQARVFLATTNNSIRRIPLIAYDIILRALSAGLDGLPAAHFTLDESSTVRS